MENIVSSAGDIWLIISTDKHKLKIKLTSQEINFIAHDLWEIIRKLQAEIDDNKKAMEGRQ